MTQRDAILNAITRSPITRAELHAETGLPDRLIRRLVAELVAEGFPIVAIENSPGGYKMGTPAEVRAEARILKSKARAINRRADSLLNGLQEAMW